MSQRITLEEYFAGARVGVVEQENAALLMSRVNALLAEFAREGGLLTGNPTTRSLVAGYGGGGFRTPEIALRQPVPRFTSLHCSGQAVDVYDPDGELDEWLDDSILMVFGLFREHPGSTRGWCHLQSAPPRSGRRTFYP